MSAETQRFTIRATASRLDKGLLAIPQRFKNLFPNERSQISVVFDDGESLKSLTFQPYDSVVKENRILGLGHWFSTRGVREGDLISIGLENPETRLYRIALERYVREKQEQRAREGLRRARTDSEAEQQLRLLAQATRRRPREVAREELLRAAEQSTLQPRPTVLPKVAERREVVPSATRILLRELHDGRCQLCSFTFQKRNGEPYFEVHHLDPKVGHNPRNLLVVCPNCHAQFEHAGVTDLRWVGDWLVSVTINGKRIAVRQPFVHDPQWKTLLGLVIIITVTRMGRFILR